MDNCRDYINRFLDWLYWKKEDILDNDYILGLLTGLGMGTCAAVIVAICFILKGM